MASGLINSWQIDGETMETMTAFIFLGSKITANSDYGHEIRKMLAPWKKSYGKPRYHNKNTGPVSFGLREWARLSLLMMASA